MINANGLGLRSRHGGKRTWKMSDFLPETSTKDTQATEPETLKAKAFAIFGALSQRMETTKPKGGRRS